MVSKNSSSQFLQAIFSFRYISTILKLKCISEHSATNIDNICVNHCNDNIVVGLIYADISDHFPIFAFVEM